MINTRHEDNFNFLFKLILVGDTGVGKTHLLSRYIKNELPKNKYPTIGVEFATKGVTLKAGGTVKAQIWDTAGQERFKAITSAHYRKSIGALIVYDITKEQSFMSVKKWIEEVREHAEPEIVIMLVGNKLDLAEQHPTERKVAREFAADYARKNHLLFMETSAFADVNVRDVFEYLVQEISKAPSVPSCKAPTVPSYTVQKSGIFVGLNKGHIVTKPKKPADAFKKNKSSRKGRRHARVQAIREVMQEVTGLAPFQRKMVEMLKTGDAVKEKKAVRMARKRTGSHKRAQLIRDKLAGQIQAQQAAARATKQQKKE